MKTIIANYVRTTSGGANWYSVSTNKLTPELLEYFQGKALRTPKYCKISEDEVSWCTQFEWADQLALSTAYSESGNLCLNTEPILSVEQRREAVQAKKLAKPQTTSSATKAVDVDPEF